MNEKETAKQRMINATKELICKGKRPSEITVADITEIAGVGNGMVNYHFQSKDNLMREAVRDVTACANQRLTKKLEPYAQAPARERLSVIIKEVFDFAAQNSEITRIAILDNLENDLKIPHFLNDASVFYDCIKELSNEDASRIWMNNLIIGGFINHIFLKARSIKEETGVDFYNKSERDAMVDNFVKSLA